MFPHPESDSFPRIHDGEYDGPRPRGVAVAVPGKDPRPRAAGSGDHHPQVIRVVKSHEADVMVGLDWISGSADASKEGAAKKWLSDHFGPVKLEAGRNFYRSAWRAENGAVLLFEPTAGEDGKKHCCIMIPGSVCQTVGGGVRIRWLAELRFAGFTFTRLDVAADFKGRDLNLVGAVRDGCRRGELCRSKSAGIRENLGPDGASKGETVYLGQRGKKGSGRMGRVYDKGLETKTAPAGAWHRFEVEFTGQCAETAATLLLQSEWATDENQIILTRGDGIDAFIGWRKQAMAMVLGAFDFRERNGSKELDRRPRSAFWNEVLAGIETVNVRQQQAATPRLEKTGEWISKAVAPVILGCAKAMGCSVMEVLSDFAAISGREIREGNGEVALQYVRWKHRMVITDRDWIGGEGIVKEFWDEKRRGQVNEPEPWNAG